MRTYAYLIICVAILCLTACQDEVPEQTKEPTPTPVKVEKQVTAAPTEAKKDVPTGDIAIFDEPIEPVVVELPSEAYPYWREAADQGKPTLVLLSIHPLLQPIEENLKAGVRKLTSEGSIADFTEHSSIYRSEPLIQPTQTVSAAIDAELFSEIIWVFPSSVTGDQIQLELFRKQVTEAGFLTEEEGNALNLSGGVFTGTVRGVPFRAVHPDVLPEISTPMILHVDLGYFKGLYQGEVKTRIYDLLHNSALALNETGWEPILTSLSYSTMDGTFSMDVRFLITNFAEMLRDPTLLDGTMPESWALRSEALYSVNFFLEGKVQEYYEQAAEKFPNDAAAQYDLYKHMFFEQRRTTEALEILDKAVALDRGYAAAYLELAQIADKDNNLPVALDLLSKAAPVLPKNPMINLYRAQFMIGLGEKEKAIPLIKELQKKNWSKHFHPDVPQLLEKMLNTEPAQVEESK